VYLAVSVALLGFGIGGSLVAIFGSKLKERQTSISKLLLFLAISIPLALFGCCFHILFGEIAEPFKVAFCHAIFLPPFILAGAILSMCLSTSTSKVGNLYAVDLLSAGLACVVFFFLLPIWGPVKLVGLTIFLMAMLSYFWARPVDKVIKNGSIVMCTVGLCLFFLPGNNLLPLQPESYKKLFVSSVAQGATIEKTIWTPLCRVDVLGFKTQNLPMYRSMFGIPWQNTTDQFKFVFQDGSAHTTILSAQSINALWSNIKHNINQSARTLVYHIKHSPDVAVIGPGGGIDILYALGFNAKSVIGAELNPAIYELTTRTHADYMGHPFNNPRVDITNEEGRSMLCQTNKRFDVIQMLGVDTLASSAALPSGAYVLSENYLYTVESFKELFSHLRNDGILCCACPNMMPPNESLRLVSLACTVYRQNKIKNIDQQIFVFGKTQGPLCLFKMTPYSREELYSLGQQAAHDNIDVLFWPKVLPTDEQGHMESQYYAAAGIDTRRCSRVFNRLVIHYAQGKENSFFCKYPYSIKPSFDDKPFFFQIHRLQKRAVPKFLVPYGHYGDLSYMTLYTVLTEATIAMLAAVIWPLWKFKRGGMSVPHALSFSIYFAAIGVGFMLIEIGMIQKCVLLLASPIYSLSIILAALLMSAGLGSILVSKLNWSAKKVTLVFGCLLLVLLFFMTLMLNPLIYSLMHLPLWLRMSVIFLIIFPVGVLMGTFFPTGLQVVRHTAQGYLPWAWGINGCASVYGSIAAIILAMSYGFTCALLVGGLVYLVGFLAALSCFRFQAGLSK
jgi:hypothetical protein